MGEGFRGVLVLRRGGPREGESAPLRAFLLAALHRENTDPKQHFTGQLMGIEKEDIVSCKAGDIIKGMPEEACRYYRRYARAAGMSREELGRVESFSVIKNWSYGRILDLGCGLGYLTSYLGACGMDKDRDAISAAGKLYPGTDFYLWDEARFADHSFDTILCYNLLEHLGDKEREVLLERVCGLLKKGGRVIFGYADPYDLSQLIKGFFARSAFFDPTHIHNWTADEFERIVSGRFRILEVKRTSPFTRWLWLGRCLKAEILICCTEKK